MEMIWQYAVFGKVTKGDEVLSRLEDLPTHTEGMFVMVSAAPLCLVTSTSLKCISHSKSVAEYSAHYELFTNACS